MAGMDVADRLLATLRIRAPGVSQQNLNLELFNALDEFFTDSSAWRWESAIPLVADDQEYPIFPPAGTDLVQVMGVKHNEAPVPPQSTDPNDTTIKQRGRIAGLPLADSDTLFEPNDTQSPGGVFRYSLYFPKYISIDVPPDAAAQQFPLVLILALKLNYQALEDDPNEWPLETYMWSQYHEGFMDGTLARLMSQINKPYSNPTMAQYHMKRFRKFTNRAKQVAISGNLFDQQNWTFPRWA